MFFSQLRRILANTPASIGRDVTTDWSPTSRPFGALVVFVLACVSTVLSLLDGRCVTIGAFVGLSRHRFRGPCFGHSGISSPQHRHRIVLDPSDQTVSRPCQDRHSGHHGIQQVTTYSVKTLGDSNDKSAFALAIAFVSSGQRSPTRPRLIGGEQISHRHSF